MPFVVGDTKKVYEKPDSGIFLGVLADVVDLGVEQTKFGPKAKVRLVWILDKSDSEGRPFRAMRKHNATMNEKGDLYRTAKEVLGTAPPVPYDIEQLLGKGNQLVILKETVGDKVFANIKGILPLPAGSVAPKIPADFIRAKDKQKNQPAAAASVGNTQSAPAPEIDDEDIPF